MRQVTKNKTISKPIKRKKTVSGRKRSHPEYGTSKLEEFFAKNFLDKLKLEYKYQYKAEDIGRYYDFAVFTKTAGSMILIEVDGDFYHSNPNLVKEDKMNPMQKHNKRVDKIKDDWAALHSIPLIRIWEEDIRKSPEKVMKLLKERFYIEDDKAVKKTEKNKRHVNKLKKL